MVESKISGHNSKNQGRVDSEASTVKDQHILSKAGSEGGDTIKSMIPKISPAIINRKRNMAETVREEKENANESALELSVHLSQNRKILRATRRFTNNDQSSAAAEGTKNVDD